jgi:DNA-binding HxlR family transcriptional regulator
MNHTPSDVATSKWALFEALSHPFRVKIIIALHQNKLTFGELKRALDITSSGHLTFHLTKLEALVNCNTQGRYMLTDEGHEAIRLMHTMNNVNMAQLTNRESRVNKRMQVIIASLGIIILILVPFAISGMKPVFEPPVVVEAVEFGYRYSSVLNRPISSAMVGLRFNPILLPQTFNVVSRSISGKVTVLHSHDFGTFLSSGTVFPFSINATHSIHFSLYYLNQTSDSVDVVTFLDEHFNSGTLVKLIEANNVTTYSHELNIREDGFYIFKFTWIDPEQVTKVTFNSII